MLPTNYFKLVIITLITTLSVTIFVLAFELHETKVELAAINTQMENIIAYPIASSQPPVPLDITYVNTIGKEFHIQTHDNAIDVGDKIINDKLTEFFLLHRKHHMLCSSDSIPVRITEKNDKASVIINLPESAAIFDIPIK